MRWSVLLRVLLSAGRLSHELIVGNPIFYLISFLVRLIDIDGSRYLILNLVHSWILVSYINEHNEETDESNQPKQKSLDRTEEHN